MKQIPAIQKATAETAIKQGIADGSIRTVKDAQERGNQVSREAARNMAKLSNQAGKEAQRAAVSKRCPRRPCRKPIRNG